MQRAPLADELPDPPRVRDVRDLEVAGDQRAVAEEAAEDALLELEGGACASATDAERRRATP